MPTVEEYSKFFDGITATAEKLYDQKGRLGSDDIQVLYKIATRFCDNPIEDAAAEELTTVYKTYYQKMSCAAISSLEQFILIREINGYINGWGGKWNQWYVGISKDGEIEQQLFTKHKVDKQHGKWIYRSVTTEET